MFVDELPEEKEEDSRLESSLLLQSTAENLQLSIQLALNDLNEQINRLKPVSLPNVEGSIAALGKKIDILSISLSSMEQRILRSVEEVRELVDLVPDPFEYVEEEENEFPSIPAEDFPIRGLNEVEGHV